MKRDPSVKAEAFPKADLEARTIATAERFLRCSDTWKTLAEAGTRLDNQPVQPETRAAIESFKRDLLIPLEEHFGDTEITYGFAGPVLVNAVRKRAAENNRFPNIHPSTDQHAGHELNTRGTRICKLDGFAVDLRFPDVSSEVVVQWIRDNGLPFDAIYLYAPERPFHLSWAAEPRGIVVQMVDRGGGRLVPRTITRGRARPTGA